MKTRFGTRALSVLLAMLLVSVVMVPAVSATEEIELIEENYVPVEIARKNVETVFNDFLTSGAYSTDKDWREVNVNPNPTPIYDINGMLLYYQFSIEHDGTEIGVIKAAANKILGCTVCTIEETPSYLDSELAIKEAKNLVQKSGENIEITSAKLVCYSYPKIGVLVEYKNSSSTKESCTIIDAYDYSIVPEDSSGYIGEPAIWSVYQEIPLDEYDTRREQWNIENSRNSNNLASSTQYDDCSGESVETVSTKSTFNYRKIWNQNNLVPQNNSVWCAVASGKMIAEWFCSSHTMSHIADEMGGWDYSENPPVPRGVTWSGEIDYYDGSQPDGLDRYLTDYWNNYMVSWDTAYNHIQTYSDPLTSAISGHERVCAGWGYYDGGSEYLYIFDPAPVDVGSTKWENWNSIQHYGYILVN